MRGFSNHIVDMRGLQLLSAPLVFLVSISEVLRKADLLWLSIQSIWSIPCLPSRIPIPIRNLRVLELGGYDFPEDEDERFGRGLQPAAPPETFWETENAVNPEPLVETLWETEPRVKTLWEPENEVPLESLELKELRVLSKLLRLPRSIGQLKHLEMIELHNFRGSSLPEEFFHLHSLKHLKLTLTAFEMKSLPDSLGKLTNLQHIDLSDCHHLQTLPASFGNLTKLQHVNLTRCFEIEVLPLQVTYQRSLVELILGCGQLKALPSAIGDLCNLKILKLDCPFLEILPPSLCNLTNLERFSIQCRRLKCLPDSIGELKQLISLSIVDTGIEYLPALPTALTSLEMDGIKGLSGIECLRELNNLEVLTVREKAHKCMVRLKRLDLTNTRITEISFGEGVCPNLQELILNSCVELEEIGALPTTLTSLEMRYCSALNRIRGISGLRKLLELGPALETLISLEWVGICKCDKVTRIESLMTAVTHDSDIFKKLVLKLNKVAEENEVTRPEDYFLESEEDYYQESEAEDYFQESEEEDCFQESEAEDFQESGAEEN